MIGDVDEACEGVLLWGADDGEGLLCVGGSWGDMLVFDACSGLLIAVCWVGELL